jgi:hypothetical protein
MEHQEVQIKVSEIQVIQEVRDFRSGTSGANRSSGSAGSSGANGHQDFKWNAHWYQNGHQEVQVQEHLVHSSGRYGFQSGTSGANMNSGNCSGVSSGVGHQEVQRSSGTSGTNRSIRKCRIQVRTSSDEIWACQM